ncbi:MAG: hypothetical protein AAB089_03435, partial [Nitrospirota bacterium]
TTSIGTPQPVHSESESAPGTLSAAPGEVHPLSSGIPGPGPVAEITGIKSRLHKIKIKSRLR